MPLGTLPKGSVPLDGTSTRYRTDEATIPPTEHEAVLLLEPKKGLILLLIHRGRQCCHSPVGSLAHGNADYAAVLGAATVPPFQVGTPEFQRIPADLAPCLDSCV